MKHIYIVIFSAVISAFLLISACGGGGGGKSSNPDVEWEVGAVSEYMVSGGSSVIVEDSLTRIDFEFPNGGYGNLSIARIESGAEAPYDGEGFAIGYDGTDQIFARVPNEGAYCVMLMGYGGSYGSRDNRDSDDWRAMAETESTSQETVFELIPASSSISAAGFASIADHSGFTYHWVAKIPSGSSDAIKLAAIKTQAVEFIGHYLDSLPSSIKNAATNEYNNRLSPTFYGDDNYYIGFTRRMVIGNSTTPMIGIMPSADQNTIAHEVGHYMHHVLIGDALYLQIEDSAPDNHGVGDSHYKRTTIAEDMAYFSQYFLLGSVNSSDAAEPALMMRDKDPELTDYPSLEGFACCLLARLNSTNSKIRDLENRSLQRDFPVVGAGFTDLFGIISKGAVNVDQLRGHVKEYLVSKGQDDKYPVILERLGWRYLAKATIVDQDGSPVKNAEVKCLCKIGSTEYYTRTDDCTTDNNGETSYIEVFPDSSLLRIEYNSDTFDIPIYVDPEGPTHVLVQLGELEINPFDLSRFTMFTISGLVFGDVKTHTPSHGDSEYWSNFDFRIGTYLHGSFTGNTFTAEWDTAIYANPVNSSGTVTITIDPQTKSLVSVLTHYFEPGGQGSEKEEYSLKISGISTYERWNEYEIYFEIEGENACLFIDEMYYRSYPAEDWNDWQELIDYDCNEESVIRVWLSGY